MQGCYHGVRSVVLRPFFLLYLPECLEGIFSEVHLQDRA
jgi:hypothetical protein